MLARIFYRRPGLLQIACKTYHSTLSSSSSSTESYYTIFYNSKTIDLVAIILSIHVLVGPYKFQVPFWIIAL